MSGALWQRFREEHYRLSLEFHALIDSLLLAAETDLNGALLNRLGRTKGIDARSLFYGPFSRVEKYASEELYAWFEQDENRRMTWEKFETAAVEQPVRIMLGVPKKWGDEGLDEILKRQQEVGMTLALPTSPSPATT